MRKSIIRSILIVCIIFGSLYLWKDEQVAKTSEYTLDIMADTVSVGEEFLVTVRVKSDKPMNRVNAYVTYDADKLEFVEKENSCVIGSEGLLYLRDEWGQGVSEREYQIAMRAIEEGETILSAEDAVVETVENSFSIELSANKKVLKIEPKRARSSSKLLENILVYPGELNQKFDDKKTEYTMTQPLIIYNTLSRQEELVRPLH